MGGNPLHEIPGFDLAGFETLHQIGLSETRRYLRFGDAIPAFDHRVCVMKIERYDDASEIEYDCLDQLLRSWMLDSRPFERVYQLFQGSRRSAFQNRRCEAITSKACSGFV